MQLKRMSLRQIRMPLVHPFETSFGRTLERRIVLVEVEDADGATGWGEVTCGEKTLLQRGMGGFGVVDPA